VKEIVPMQIRVVCAPAQLLLMPAVRVVRVPLAQLLLMPAVALVRASPWPRPAPRAGSSSPVRRPVVSPTQRWFH